MIWSSSVIQCKQELQAANAAWLLMGQIRQNVDNIRWKEKLRCSSQLTQRLHGNITQQLKISQMEIRQKKEHEQKIID